MDQPPGVFEAEGEWLAYVKALVAGIRDLAPDTED